MPKYTNKFAAPTYIQQLVLGADVKVVGTIRIKPSSVCWKPSGQQRFYCVPLDKFIAWITDPATSAGRTKS